MTLALFILTVDKSIVTSIFVIVDVGFVNVVSDFFGSYRVSTRTTRVTTRNVVPAK